MKRFPEGRLFRNSIFSALRLLPMAPWMRWIAAFDLKMKVKDSIMSETDGVGMRGTKGPLIIGLCLISLLVVLYFMAPDFRDFLKESYRILTSGDDARVREWVEKIGIWGPIIIIGVGHMTDNNSIEMFEKA
jgi:hypothetical protein